MDAPAPGKTLAQYIQDVATLESQLLTDAEANHGEISPVLEELLKNVLADTANKADRMKFYLDRLEYSSQMLLSQADQIARAANALDAAQEYLKNQFKQAMVQTGTEEVKGNAWRWKLTPTKGRIETKGSVPLEYLKPAKDVSLYEIETKARWLAGQLIERTILKTSGEATQEWTHGFVAGYRYCLQDLGTPDKDKIREAINRGETVEGATLVTDYSLRSYVNKEAK